MIDPPQRVVFLLDVDNTLLDNDRVVLDLTHHMDREFGPESREQYFTIFEQLRAELGYADYLGALQRYRAQHPRDTRLLGVSSFLLDYPFADRLYPGALEVVRRFSTGGLPVVFSDGDVVFQPRKVQRSGLWAAVEGRVLVYIHKEQVLDDVEARYPAAHYVFVDDKPRLIGAIKQAWGARVTTVQPVQGHYANDPLARQKYPAADLTVERVGDLVNIDFSAFYPGARKGGRSE